MSALRHGHRSGRMISPTYQSWRAMLTRCKNKANKIYLVYGAVGIKVAPRWETFDNFLADMGVRPGLNYTLDRHPDPNGNYEPGNCRWATRREQARNRKTNRPVVRTDGLRFPTIIAAAEATGGNRRCIRDVCTGRQKTHQGHTWSFA